MSGAGKSFWTRRLAAAGFRTISIDDRIEEKLSGELAAGGYRGIGGIAAWMGWPDQRAYCERAQMYLDNEIEAMQEALDEIERSAEVGIVLDTTGSVVYTGDEIIRRLRELTTVVYLEATEAEERLLIERYLSDPKPVLWGARFDQREGESAKDAIARCYPHLVAERKALYKRAAHMTIPMPYLRDPALDARGFLELIDTKARPAQ
jgi:shikimate kinase